MVLVAIAAGMWATDAYFRPALTKQLSSAQIVLVEDLLISVGLVPVLVRALAGLRRLGVRRWAALALIAIGPQALATVLFTQSIGFAFRGARMDTEVLYEVYLLYLLQPVFGLIFARLLLGERRQPRFWPFAATALGGGYLIVFADSPGAPWHIHHVQLVAAALVLGAVCMWAGGTVLGRYALEDVSWPVTTAMRFILALPVLLLIVVVGQGGAGFHGYAASQLPYFLGIAVIPGLAAMLLYYFALASTPASLATIAELGYPAVLFFIFTLPPPVGLGSRLTPLQVAGSILLTASVLALNYLKLHRVVETPRGDTVLVAESA